MKLTEILKLAWENKEQIAEGFYNTYISMDKEREQEAQRRLRICESNQCGYYDKEGKPETSAIPGKPACSICHCNIELMTHSMSKTCSLKLIDKTPLWESVLTDEQERHVKQIEWENQFKKK